MSGRKKGNTQRRNYCIHLSFFVVKVMKVKKQKKKKEQKRKGTGSMLFFFFLSFTGFKRVEFIVIVFVNFFFFSF